MDADGLVVSAEKVVALRELFGDHVDRFTEPAVFDEHFMQVRNFLLMMAAEVLNGSGMREEMTFHLSVCCPALLLAGDAVVLSEEVERFTGLLMDLNRVTAVEKKRMDRSFPLFLERFRSLATSVSIDGAGSAVAIFRVCDSVPARQLFRYLMCLNESPLLPLGTVCVEVGQLSSDVTTSVCSSISSFFKSHSVRNYESVSGPPLDEVSLREMSRKSEFLSSSVVCFQCKIVSNRILVKECNVYQLFYCVFQSSSVTQIHEFQSLSVIRKKCNSVKKLCQV